MKAMYYCCPTAGAIHSVKNIGSGNGAKLATYVVEKGKPLITLVK